MHEEYTLVGQDGNAYNIMAYVAHAMKQEKRHPNEIDAYIFRAMSSNYDNLIYESMMMISELNMANGYE